MSFLSSLRGLVKPRGLVALSLAAAPFVSTGCISSPNPSYNHWSIASVEGSLANYFLGFDP